MVVRRQGDGEEACGGGDGESTHRRVEVVVEDGNGNRRGGIHEEGKRGHGGKAGSEWGMKRLPRGRVHIEDDESEMEQR